MNFFKQSIITLFLGLVGVGIISAQSSGIDFLDAYEKFGLTYNREKEAYCYNDKIIGIFVNEQGRGFWVLNQSGEIHVKAVRDSAGSVINIAELSPTEYAEIEIALEELDARRIVLDERKLELDERRLELDEMRERLEAQKRAILYSRQ